MIWVGGSLRLASRRATDKSVGPSPNVTGIKAGLASLKGKRVGVETGALGAYMLTRALQKGELTLKDIEPVSLSPGGHEAAFHAGEVDAIRRMAPRTGLSPAAFSIALKGIAFPTQAENSHHLAGGLLDPARRLQEVMLQQRLLPHPVDSARLLKVP